VVSSRFGTTSVAAWLARLPVVLAICFTVSVQAAGRVIAASCVGAMRILDLLYRARCLLPILLKVSERAAVNAIGTTRVMSSLRQTVPASYSTRSTS
jgi:hypothetical protein